MEFSLYIQNLQEVRLRWWGSWKVKGEKATGPGAVITQSGGYISVPVGNIKVSGSYIPKKMKWK